MIKKVLKFGGTSVGTIDRIRHVANIIKKEISLGNKIQTVRKNRNISQHTLSEKAGLARTFISAVEQGKQNVSLGSLKSIADSLDVSLSSMLED